MRDSKAIVKIAENLCTIISFYNLIAFLKASKSAGPSSFFVECSQHSLSSDYLNKRGVKNRLFLVHFVFFSVKMK